MARRVVFTVCHGHDLALSTEGKAMCFYMLSCQRGPNVFNLTKHSNTSAVRHVSLSLPNYLPLACHSRTLSSAGPFSEGFVVTCLAISCRVVF